MARAESHHYIPRSVEALVHVTSRQTLATLAVSALCVGILVLFTDIEAELVRWVNCSAIATEAENNSDVCR